MKLLETETHFFAESGEIAIERMRYLTQVLGVERNWELVLFRVFSVEGGQPGGGQLLGFAILNKV
jgi:hypothetical protein